jgi:hypothetical protein
MEEDLVKEDFGRRLDWVEEVVHLGLVEVS